MNAPFVVAQAITTGQATQQVVKLTKPANGQAVTLTLDANTRLDFSGIAVDQITLVRVGNQLVVLFDNQATLTMPLFFDPNGNPRDGIVIDLGNRVVDGQEFAGLFPISTNQTILPAAGRRGRRRRFRRRRSECRSARRRQQRARAARRRDRQWRHVQRFGHPQPE